MPIATTNARRSLLSNAVGVLSDVSALALRISIVEAPGGGLIKTMSFTQSMTVYDACRHIRDKLLDEYNLGQPKDYGLFLFDETTSEGVWLEQNRTLDYYMLRNNDTLEYRKKIRPLRVRMLDDSIKTLLVDDSQPVSNLMVVICTKIGITNHDEYALVRNEPELVEATDAKPNTGTLTLKRKKQEERERDAKMEQLRKTLRTDDEVDWVDPLKTLREQGIDETETLLLRRKFFFSDGNIDSRDPVELNLLYVQARDAILDGTHPVTQDQACEFAGIQVHIQFGDYNESKHRPGFLDLKEFLPQSYIKDKGIEKKIYSEHKKHIGVSEVEAKVLYTKTARSLTTYGVTFFLVKEKMQGKNKLVPRLLGITKDSILRLDEKTKEILKTWPLTTVRRWGASPNTFTLDFGDYSDAYYSVKTPEAEQILQLIDGYIDIILKKQQAKEHIGLVGEEGATLFEDNVSSKQATVMRHGNLKPTNLMPELMSRISMRAAMTDTFQDDLQHSTFSAPANLIHAAPSPQRKMSKTINVMTEPKRALLMRLNSTRDMLQEIQQLVSSTTDLPELGADTASHQWREITLDTCRHNVAGYIAAMNAATAQVVLLTANEEIDFNAVAAAIQMIQNNLPEMTKDVKMIAVLMDDKQKGEKLLHSTRNLLEAFEDLISEAEPQKSGPRENILNAATRIGEASQSVLSTISEESEQNKELQNILLSLGKAIASNTAAVVLKAKSIATNCKNEEAQTKVIDSATECALATSELVTCTNVVASTIHNPACQAQLMASIRETSRCLESLVTDCVDSCQSKTLQGELQSAAQIVTEKLNDLVNHITKGTSESYEETNLETVLVASDKIIATENPSEMVKQAQILGQAATQLLQSIKSEADKQTDPEMQERLLNIGYNLAEATAQLVEAARHCANSPGDATYQNALRRAAEQLREVTSLAATTPAIKMHALEKLEQHARQAASDAAQYVYAVKAISPEHKNDPQWTALEEDCTVVKEHMNKMIDAACRFKRQPEQLTVQMGLVNTSEQFLQPAWRLIHAMRSITTTLPPSHTSAMVATAAAQQLTTSIGALESSLGRAKTALVAPSSKIMQSEVESVEDTNKKWAKEQFDASTKVLFGLQQELEELDRVQKLTPLPGETPESSAATLISVAKSIPQITAQLISAIEQNEHEYAGRMASTLASSLQELTSASRSVAAQDPSVHHGIINSAREVVVNSNDLLRDIQSDILDSEGKLKPNVIKTMKDISEAANRCLNNLPGQQDVDEVISNMNAKFNTLTIDEFPPPPSDKTYNELQQELNIAAAHLNDISADLISSVSNPVAFANCSRAYEQAYNRLHGISLEMIGQSQDPIVSQQIVDYLKHMLSVSSKLLQTAKLVSADPTAPNNKNKLTAAARGITDSINDLLDIYSTAAPGQKECDNVTRNIQNLKPVINNPTEPISDLSYFECLDAVIEKSKKLGDAMTGITNYAKNSEHEKFGVAVKDVDNSVSGLIEAATQAAYLVGISDPTSIPGRPGLVDQAQFARASQAIATACQTISNPKTSQPEILSATTLIAKQTTALCNACKTASSQTNNPVAKRQFVQSAKDLANSTSALIKDIKVLDSDISDVNRNKCIEATKPLLDIVDNICVFASSSEFVSHPAKISTKAKEKQGIIIQPGCKIIDSSSAMVTAAKSLVISPRDPPTWQMLINSIKEVSDAIKKILSNMSENYPGQNECVEVINSLYSHLKSLDASSMAMMSGQSTGQFNSAVPGTQQEKLSLALSAANEISDRIEAVRVAGRGQTQNLGRAVIDMARYFNPLVNGCIGASTTLLNSKHQMLLIDQTKTVTESATQLMYAVKESGGNPKALNVHPEIDEYASSIQKALQELMSTLDQLSTQSGVYTGVIDTVARSMSKLTNQQLSPSLNYSESDNYVDFQTRMVENSKEIAHLVQEIVSKATTSPSEIGPLCSEFSRRYVALANDAPGAAACCSNSEVSHRMRGVVLELGQAVSSLVGAVSTGTSRGMADEARVVSEKVAQVLATLQFGSRGIQACINAASTISGVIGDLDTTIMFATAGTLQPDDEEDSFSHHREAILKTAKVLVGDIKALVAGTASTQDQLAVAVQNSVTTIVQLSEVVKVGAACLSSSSPDAQIMLMNAVRDVASALGDLVQATKGASRKSISHPTMDRLKKSANVMETNITMLLNTVKSVEDEHTRGTRALESTIEVIGQEMKVLYSTSSVQKVNATPEELMQCTKAITVATAKAVAAGNSNKQDDMIQAANIGRKAISDMLVICKGTAHNCAETKELRERTLNAGNEVAILYKELLQLILISSTENRQMIPNVSRRLAKNVNELVIVAKLLKGSNWVDPEDPTVIAENELLTAAASIDAAAKKLASLRPRKIVQETDETLNFDEMIIEAAKSIAGATSALVKAASAAQRELIETGKVTRRPSTSSDDGQWSEGLVSAARMVAAATHTLVESANSLVQGVASEEKLISAAKQVASSTKQLLFACQVKADPDSDSMKRLQSAGNAVAKATENLVKSAQQSIDREEKQSVEVNRNMVGKIAQELDRMAEVLRIEKELEKARAKLVAVRKDKYT